jgi:peroxiredoxin Q/BCP
MGNIVEVGTAAPDFSLPSGDGRQVSLTDFKGKRNVVLYFYPADETRGCTAEACSFRDNYEAFAEAGAEVIGISSDSPESHRRFSAHHNLPFVLLSDTDKRVRKLYGVPSTLGLLPGRVTYIIDKSGIVRHIFDSQFQPKKHIEEALKVLKSIEGRPAIE